MAAKTWNRTVKPVITDTTSVPWARVDADEHAALWDSEYFVRELAFYRESVTDSDLLRDHARSIEACHHIREGREDVTEARLRLRELIILERFTARAHDMRPLGERYQVETL